MIKNCIFDFGGVLFKIAPERSIKAFRNLSGRGDFFTGEELKHILSKRGFLLYENGKISSSQFRDFLRDELYITADDSEIDKAWNLTLIEKFDFASSIVEEIKSRYKIALLSNTNEIHYNYFEPQCRDLFARFDRCFFSHHMKMRKPDGEIFETLLEEMNYKPEETIFIDDSEINIKAAVGLGLATYHVADKNKLSDLINVLNINLNK